MQKFKRMMAVLTAAIVVAIPAVANAAPNDALFMNLGPVPRGVKVGTPQTVFQFVKSGSSTGPAVADVAVHFAVVSGPDAGQSGIVRTDSGGQALWRFATTKASPVTGATDYVTAWADSNNNGIREATEPANTNPFFTEPAAVNGSLACEGRAATIVAQGNTHTVNGTGGPDVIAVLNNDTTVWAGDGDDVVCSWGDRTTVYGANGNDHFTFYGSDSLLYAGDGDDTAVALNGIATLFGGNGNDTLTVGDAPSTLWGGNGDDTLIAGFGRAKLSGDAGVDHLISAGSSGTYWGGTDYDFFSIAGRTYRN